MQAVEGQWFVIALAICITILILVIDASLWRTYGIEYTFSRAWGYLHDRYPVSSALLLIWIGILVGHLLPAMPK
jgi:hypothetical protein